MMKMLKTKEDYKQEVYHQQQVIFDLKDEISELRQMVIDRDNELKNKTNGLPRKYEFTNGSFYPVY